MKMIILITVLLSGCAVFESNHDYVVRRCQAGAYGGDTSAAYCDQLARTVVGIAAAPKTSANRAPAHESDADVARQIRQECMDRMILEHGKGGDVPDFSLC